MCHCVKGDEDFVELLFGRRDLDVNVRNQNGNTALILVCGHPRNAQCAHALKKQNDIK